MNRVTLRLWLCIFILSTGSSLALPDSEEVYINPFIPKLPEKKPEIVEEVIVPTAEEIPPIAEEKGEVIEPPKPVITPPSLTINGLVWNSEFPQAIVNNQIVKLGDTIEGVTVVGIHREGIDITFEGTQFTINKDANDQKGDEENSLNN